MSVQKAHIYALQEAIIATNTLAVSARAPYLIKYYNFLTRNLTSLLKVLREPPPRPPKTLFWLLDKHNEN